jgi:hypothetical protein
MKKSTLIVLVIALGLGGWVYYSEIRHPKAPAAEESAPKAIFHLNPLDVAGVRLERAEGVVALERRENEWELTEPIAARGDQRAADALASALAEATSNRALEVGADKFKEYGLDPPALTAVIRAKSGQQHRLRLGEKDFTGDVVYAVLDDGNPEGGKPGGPKEVLLVPASLLSSATKSLNELRDRSVLVLHSREFSAIGIQRAAGDFRLEKQGKFWNLLSPRAVPADDSATSTLSGAISSGEFTEVESETAKDLARYGLVRPAITVRVKTEKGEEGTLLIGKKENDKYYARDAARSMVFRVDSSFVDKLDVSVEKLRDKHVLRFEEADITHIRVNNGMVNMAAGKDASGKWIVEEPADRKGKEFDPSHVFTPVANFRATELIDAAGKAIVAKLDKPVVEVEFTTKQGKVLKLVVSPPEESTIYARTNLGATIFKADKFFLTDIKFTAAEAAP